MITDMIRCCDQRPPQTDLESEADFRRRCGTFDVLVAATQSAMDAGQLKLDDPECVAGPFWSALHGYVMLELAGFMRTEDGAAHHSARPLLVNLGTALSINRS